MSVETYRETRARFDIYAQRKVTTSRLPSNCDVTELEISFDRHDEEDDDWETVTSASSTSSAASPVKSKRPSSTPKRSSQISVVQNGKSLEMPLYQDKGAH